MKRINKLTNYSTFYKKRKIIPNKLFIKINI